MTLPKVLELLNAYASGSPVIEKPLGGDLLPDSDESPASS